MKYIIKFILRLKDFKPKIKKFIIEEKASDNSNISNNVILSKDQKIEITQMFKPNQHMRPIFNFSDPYFSTSEYYDAKYCTDALLNYLKKKDLFLEKGEIMLDEILRKIRKT